MIFLKYLFFTFVAGVNVKAEYTCILIQWLYIPFSFAKSQIHFS